MKRKFKDTSIGVLLTSKVGKFILGIIPGVGQIADNILEETREVKTVKGNLQRVETVSESGSLNLKNPKQIIAGIITLVILYLALSGKISFEDAEQAKDFIQD